MILPTFRFVPFAAALGAGLELMVGSALADEAVIPAYSNSTTNSNLSNPSGNILPYGADFVTPMQMDDLELLPGSGGQMITSVTFCATNSNALGSGSCSVFALLSFYQDNGTGGGPGTLIGTLAGKTPDIAPTIVGRFTLKPVGAQRFALPLNGRVWAGVAFASGNGANVTTTQLAHFGVPFYNPPTVGASTPSYFVSSDGGSYSTNFPGGTMKTGTAARSSFCWDMTTAVLGPVNVTDTTESGNPGSLRYANNETTASVPIAFRVASGSPSTITLGSALPLQINPTVFQLPAGADTTIASGTAAAVISGTRGLSITGPGTIRFNGANTYSGGTSLSSSASVGLGNAKATGTGAILVTGNSSLFASGGPVTPANAIAVSASTTLAVGTAPEGPQTLTLPGIVSGAGTLEMRGAGTLGLSGANTFSGGLTLTSGAVEVAAAAPLGATTNPINFNGGTLRVTGTALSGFGSHLLNSTNFNGGIEIADAGNVFAIGAPISGAGSLIKTGAGRLVLNGFNSLAGGVVLSAGQLSFSGPNAALATSASLRVDGGTFIVPPVSPFSIGGLSGAGGVIRNDSVTGGSSSPLVLSIGNGGGTASYAGVISDALGNYPISLEKLGAGTQTFSSAQLYSGATRVREGTLILSSAQTNTSALTIETGATFSFAGNQLGSASGASTIPVTNNGTFILSGGPLALAGAIVNNGTLRVVAGASLNATGSTSFVNNGVIDLREGTAQLPANFSNGPGGVVLTPGLVGIKTINRMGDNVTVSIDGLSGRTYHLQKSSTLVDTDFSDTPAPAQQGDGASVLIFTDTSTPGAAFYRIRID